VTLRAVTAVSAAPCPSCADAPTGPCDRCDGSRVIAVVTPPKSTRQIIAELLALIRAKVGG